MRQKIAIDQWATLMTLGDYWKRLPRQIIDAAGQTTSLTYNSRGQLTSTTNSLSEQTVLRYDPDVNFDPENGTPSDQPGFLVRVEGPEIDIGIPGPVHRYGYDSYQRPRTIITPDNATLTYDYDGLHRPVRVTHPDQTFEQTVYHRLDVAAARDREGRWTRTWHDAGGQLRLERDPLGRYTQYDWCTCGGLGAIVDGEGNRTEWKYDLQGRITKKIYPDLTEVEYHYHEHTGQLELVIDALDRTRSYTYWLDGKLKKIDYINPFGNPGNLPATPSVEYFYDDYFPRLAKMTTAGLGDNTYTYHPVDGQTLGAGMLHEVAGPFADDTITYTYDELGRRAKRQINGLANEETHVYDPVGRIERIVNPLGQFDYEYVDPTGRLDKLIYPNGQITNFSYHGQNNDFRLQKIENLEPPSAGPDPLSEFEYTYTVTGMIDTWKQQAGTAGPNTWTFGYDRAQQLDSAVLRDSLNVVQQSLGYGYDNAGNRTHERKASGELDDTPGRGALHNENNQLTSYSDAGAVRFAGEIDQGAIVWVDGQQAELDVDDSGTEPVQTFETWLALEPGINQIVIDAVNAAGLASQQTYEVNVADQGSVDFVYDAAGNMTDRTNGSSTTRYRWDAENRLVEIIYPDDSTTEFQYDGLGRRVRIHEKDATGGTVSGGNRTFVWDGLKIAEERNPTGATVEKQFFEHGVQEGSADYFYTKDHLGSIREVIDNSGAVVARYDYDPYGRVEQTSGTLTSDFLFTGHFYHAKSGLHLAPYRAYDAELGRWLNRDPIGHLGGHNLYRYVGNNMINFWDLLGLYPDPLNLPGPHDHQRLPGPNDGLPLRPPLPNERPRPASSGIECPDLVDVIGKTLALVDTVKNWLEAQRHTVRPRPGVKLPGPSAGPQDIIDPDKYRAGYNIGSAWCDRMNSIEALENGDLDSVGDQSKKLHQR